MHAAFQRLVDKETVVCLLPGPNAWVESKTPCPHGKRLGNSEYCAVCHRAHLGLVRRMMNESVGRLKSKEESSADAISKRADRQRRKAPKASRAA